MKATTGHPTHAKRGYPLIFVIVLSAHSSAGVIPSADYGDAPDSYLTLEASGGAAHQIDPDLFIGSLPPDADSDGFSDGADGGTPGDAADDDTEGTTPDDEDGAANFPVLSTIARAFGLSVPVTNLTGSEATLFGWIDFNRDGEFQAGEGTTAPVPDGTTGNNPARLLWTDSVVNQGINTISPGGGTTYIRLRLTTDNSITVATPGGPASNGEVEDHAVNIDTRPLATTTVNGDGVIPVFDQCLGTLVAAFLNFDPAFTQSTGVEQSVRGGQQPGAHLHFISPENSLLTGVRTELIDGVEQTTDVISIRLKSTTEPSNGGFHRHAILIPEQSYSGDSLTPFLELHDLYFDQHPVAWTEITGGGAQLPTHQHAIELDGLAATATFHYLPADTFDKWITPFHQGLDADPTADPDGDDLHNLLEYALCQRPDHPNTPPITTAIVAGKLRITATRSPHPIDIDSTIEISDSLDPDAWTTAGTTVLVDDPTTLTVEVDTPFGSNSRLFVRLKVTLL